jgi:hypothetical protein
VSSAIQQVHDLEIGGAIGWPVEGKIVVRVGCPLEDRFESEALVSSFSEAEQWLRKAGKLAPPKRGEPQRISVVDELYSAGMPVSALWIFDSMFQATFAAPENTSAQQERWIDARSWAELEQKLRAAAYFRRPQLLKKRAKP